MPHPLLSVFLFCFVAALIPLYGIKYLLPIELARRVDWELVEISIVYIDIGLYGLTVLLWAGVFIVEEVRAVRKILGGR